MKKRYDKFEEYLKMNHQRIEIEYSNNGLNIFLMMNDIMIINDYIRFDEMNHLEDILESFIFDYGDRFWKMEGWG